MRWLALLTVRFFCNRDFVGLVLIRLSFFAVGYGCAADQTLAKSNPSQALRNADNYNVSPRFVGIFLWCSFGFAVLCYAGLC